MPTTTVLGNAFHSVTQNGPSLFDQGPFTTWVGNLVIDLAGAPLPSGKYRLEAEVVIVGNVEIFLPREASYTLNGTTLLGERKVRDGLDAGKVFRSRLDRFFGRPSEVPQLPEGQRAITRGADLSFELQVSTAIGEVKVYRV
jgi:predicted membrane protein